MIGLFSDSNFNKVFNNTFSGGNILFTNALSDYEYSNTCIKLEGASYNQIYGNVLEVRNIGVSLVGVSLGTTHGNNIYFNKINSISKIGKGISSTSAVNNTLCANSIINCSVGISLSSSNQFSITQNSIINCSTGVRIWQSSNNQFYNNNFLDSTQHVCEDQYTMMPPSMSPPLVTRETLVQSKAVTIGVTTTAPT